MIKINLLAEKKQAKAKAPAVKLEVGGTRNVILGGIVVAGLAVAVLWSWSVSRELADWTEKIRVADAEIERLKPVLEKAKVYEQRQQLLEKKINLIKELKKKQAVPVHILDQVSKNLPDFLWLNNMAADNNLISITGKATTYNAVSNFYRNLTGSGYFGNVTLGRTFEVPEGVSFSLTCEFAPGTGPAAAKQEAQS